VSPRPPPAGSDSEVTAEWTAVGGLGPDRPAAWGLFVCGEARAALRGCVLELCEESAAAAVSCVHALPRTDTQVHT
jgi:hypothetical protein